MGNCSSANDSQRSNLDQVGAATLDADLRVKRSTSHLKFAEQEKAAREPKSTVIRRRKTIQPASELHNVKASAVMTVEVKEVPTSTSTTSTAGETPLPTRPRKRHGGATVAPAPITTLSSTASSSTTTIPAIVLTEEPLKQFKQRVSGGVAVASGSEQLPGETPKSPRALRAKVTLPEDDESETATATEGASNIASTSNEPPLNIDACIERLRKAGSDRANLKTICLSMDEIEAIVGQARAIVYYQPMLLRLTAPLKIVGDTHGEYCVGRVRSKKFRASFLMHALFWQVNFRTCFGSLTVVDIHRMPTTSSSATTLIAGGNRSRPFYYCFATKVGIIRGYFGISRVHSTLSLSHTHTHSQSNTRKTSFFSAATTSAQA